MKGNVWCGALALLLVGALAACGGSPAGTGDGTQSQDGGALTSPAVIYYYLPYKGWSQANIHHDAAGAWTAVPGVAMAPACPNWLAITLNSSASSFQAVFTDGQGHWDNPTGGGNYVVGGGISVVQNGKLTANAANPCATPPPAVTATVFYKIGWAAPNIHHNGSGSWTASPGVAMDGACAGWFKKAITLGAGATAFQAVFNDGKGTWDNNGGRNYTLASGVSTVSGGVVTSNATDPCGTVDTTPPTAPSTTSASASGTTITVSWAASTDAESGVARYVITRTGGTQGPVTLSSTSTTLVDAGLTADTLYTYTVVAVNGAGLSSAAGPQAQVRTGAAPPGATITVYYANTAAWGLVNMHYQKLGVTWTTPPGEAMTKDCDDWWTKQVDLGTATSMKADFNNGSAWDNNSGADYVLTAGIVTVRNKVVTKVTASPCTPDVTPPSAPGTPTATVTGGVNVNLAWAASTDDRGLAGYDLTRTGGSRGTVALTSGVASFYDPNLDENTSYTYAVRARDKAGNVSAWTPAVQVRTTVVPPPPPTPDATPPIGTDPREDAIYFVMTARFYDGDPTNNRGGSQHVRSGNAANNDPMFRGDFAGLIQKLDYIKALGFSAIWITPVVLNRSDYDFHGYHGWDFYRVDPRLESAGATYQDLINAAHAKGIKIIQDVVYNHSSRWGAKGLWTTKVFGVRDSQWSWYYDQPVAGLEYDGLTIDPNTGKSWYNGDLWSTAEPVGNTCRSWGVATQYSSPEGYRIYNCQWPNPTSGMFPAQYFHQCWIGNWEGEDSRSCWLHEDLADFNTESAAVQQYLIGAYNRFVDMGVDGFRVDTAVHIPRVTWNRRLLPPLHAHAQGKWGAAGQNFFVFGEVAAFVNDKWNRGSVNHSAQFFTWKERKEYTQDDVQAALDQYNYEQQLGTGNQPTSTNAFLDGNAYHAPDHSQFSGMNIIDMRMHNNFYDARNAFQNGMDSDDATNDSTYNVVYVDSHDYGPGKSLNTYAGGTDAWAENMSLMWTFRGIPTLYMGSEIEFKAGAPIDCGPNCPLSTTRRAYYGDNLAGTVTAADFGVTGSATGAVAATMDKPLVKHLQRLNQIPPAHPGAAEGPVLHRRRQRLVHRPRVQAALHRRGQGRGQLRAGHHLQRRHVHRHPQRHVQGRHHR
ncbi:MAG: carbohydrate binding domain-containing protein [Anaeromyxobacter sp.]